MSTSNSTPARDVRIVAIDVRNTKRVTAFHLTPEDLGAGNLITIAGENANGKSSVLDAIEATLTANFRGSSDMCRRGSRAGGCRIRGEDELGSPFEVARLFNASGGATLKVTIGGVDVTRPADFVRSLTNGQTLDPVEFLSMEPREQRDALAQVVGLDLSAEDSALAACRERLRDLAREQERTHGRVERIEPPSDPPAEPADTTALAAELAKAEDVNRRYEALTVAVQTTSAAEAAAIAERDRLAKMLEAAEMRVAEAMGRSAAAIDARAAATCIDTGPLLDAMRQAEEVNQRFRAAQTYQQARAEWRAAEEAVAQEVQRERELVEAKKARLAACQFPVPGLSFDETQVTLDGVPFANASHAEQLNAAVGIALSKRGRLPLLFVRDASTMDAKSLRRLAEIAEQYGATVFAEIVANLDDDGFDRDASVYIVDGARTQRDGHPEQPALEVGQ